MILSIIIPCYNEETVINLIYKKITEITLNYTYELIFIDDGSKDKTVSIIENICSIDKHVRYISFSRNFGKEAAMLAGLQYSIGDCVIILDADLQHPPELIPKMIEQYNNGYDQVIAKRNRIGEAKLKSLSAKTYYKLVNKLVDVKMIDGIGDFRLLSRKAINALLSMTEYNRFSKGLFSWIGFNQIIIEYDNNERASGNTKWSFKSLLQYGIDGILSFNNRPLRVCFSFGSIILLVSLLYIFVTLIQIIMYGIAVPGYFTIISSILIIGGIQLISVGVLGEYIGRIYYEVKNRPHFLINTTNIDDLRINKNDER